MKQKPNAMQAALDILHKGVTDLMTSVDEGAEELREGHVGLLETKERQDLRSLALVRVRVVGGSRT